MNQLLKIEKMAAEEFNEKTREFKYLKNDYEKSENIGYRKALLNIRAMILDVVKL